MASVASAQAGRVLKFGGGDGRMVRATSLLILFTEKATYVLRAWPVTIVMGSIQLYLDVAINMDIDHLISFPKALYLLQTSRKQGRELNAMSDELEIDTVRTRRTPVPGRDTGAAGAVSAFQSVCADAQALQ